MGDVKSLYGGPVRPPGADEDCVRLVRELLEKAESGEITAISAVLHHQDDCTSMNFAGFYHARSMIGALEMLKARMVAIALTDE